MIKKNIKYLCERKTFVTKHMYHAVLNIVCLETFSENRKENELHRKYTLLGGPAGNLSPPTILQIKQI